MLWQRTLIGGSECGHSIKQLCCPGVYPHVCTRVCAFMCMSYFTVWRASSVPCDARSEASWEGALLTGFLPSVAFQNSRAGREV